MEVFRTVPKPNTQGFKPVVVVLESDIEARLMWILVNYAGVITRSDRMHNYELNDSTRIEMDGMRDRWWDTYNAQYCHPNAS